MDYKKTLNLPNTSLPMRANLPKNEPKRVERWVDRGIYQKMVERNLNKSRFILHDGPPYANGYIHSGTVLNKILKDMVVKYRNMTGFETEFIPGWDCHGLPIENNVEKELGQTKDSLSVEDFRERCREFALRFVDIQSKDFQRLGVLGDWDNPYLTLRHSYEATIAREFGRVMASGAVYQGKKPVYWCSEHKTALAEAEIEYGDHTAPSIWVKFRLGEEALAKMPFCPADKEASIIIWTTTPWTLPANLAITLHPAFDYALIEAGDEAWLVAEDMVEDFSKAVGLTEPRVLGKVRGAELENTTARHPFIDRDSLLILGNFVTLEAGTGCVHTAPGHGMDDYIVGLKYGLEAYAPVDDTGCFTEDMPEFQGRHVFDTDQDIIKLLDEKGALLKTEKMEHSYPHCQRCRKPVIFRATDQWFVAMDKTSLRQDALRCVDQVEWIPSRGHERIRSMIETRPDWCISRQRLWGLPIIVFHCQDCGTPHMDPKVVYHVADIFEREGADAWFTRPATELLPEGTCCESCGGTSFSKDENIIDVWFESGVSYAAVIENRYGEDTITDLYLEGSDQHRGWFHSSMLESVATRQRPPYRTVLTHGFVVDGAGKKISKTLGNYIPPKEIIDKYGAELYRLWVASENYQDDIRLSPEILKNLVDAYRKLRNTFRFLLGNLDDYSPGTDAVAYADLLPMDRWMLHRTNELIQAITDGYENYDFHRIFHHVVNFTNVDLSSLYLDVLKDRLYVGGRYSLQRRSARTVLYQILRSLVLALAPVLSFTCEEVWEHMPRAQDDQESVFLESFPAYRTEWVDEALAREFLVLRQFRTEAQKLLEDARTEKVIGHSLGGAIHVDLGNSHAWSPLLKKYSDFLGEWLIVSRVTLNEVDDDGIQLSVTAALGEKCPRCWHITEDVGQAASHPERCISCARVMEMETK